MPNPPTQGRKEAITKGAKALEDSRFFSATSWKAKEMFRELAQAVLDAAYPEQTERDDWGDVSRETLMATESERNTAEQRAEKAERERDEWQRARSEAESKGRKAETDRDRLQREVERLTVWASHKREHIYKVEGERDRLQRECDRLREALREITETFMLNSPIPEGNHLRNLALGALEKS